MSNAAAFARKTKDANPANYCHDPECLWRIVTARGPSPCKNHPLPGNGKPLAERPTITRAAWRARHRDFKHVMDGQPMILRCNPATGGSELVAVTITEDR